ncbi:hypothetical protein CKALI_01520 [Corynebacterium kalinowskii]|uniref:Uncharacterized protein n=1 Tax=Corynebacterium kalinowskii TaxID=2675216 RepID=A0A6B8VA40_9CORY|nr:hypothetical protein CKALI_01520 [Corynebacterium kalinowskii]
MPLSGYGIGKADVIFSLVAHEGSTSDPLDKALVCLIVAVVIPVVS